MKLFSQFRNYISSTYSVLVNFPVLTIDSQFKIQYAFDISTNLRQTTHRLHEPTFDKQDNDLPTLLILHGTSGGIDAARWHALGLSRYSSQSDQQRPYQILSISRPGYLSSQPKCNSFSQEASVIDQICQHLNLEQLAIMAVSGSGPTALTFVRDYPKRVKGLILMDAISKRPSFSSTTELMSLNTFGRNITSNLISYFWNKYWRPEQLVRFEFSGWDTVEEIRTDKSVESMYRDYYLPTFTWGGYRRSGFHAELKHLKNDLEEQPNWKVHVPLLYLYGQQDQWVTDEHIDCVIQNVKNGVPKKVVPFPKGKHLLPVKESSILVNDFLWKHVFQ